MDSFNFNLPSGRGVVIIFLTDHVHRGAYSYGGDDL
jgi:hypothetical protein